jgi:hypothetical protein
MKHHYKVTELKVPYIGFIKNNQLRRVCMVISMPFVFVLIMMLNFVLSICVYIGTIFLNIKSIKNSFIQVWEKPRVKQGKS